MRKVLCFFAIADLISMSFSRHIRYWDLVMLDQNIKNSKTDHLHSLATDMRKDPSTKLPPPPDDQMICYDTL